MTVPRPREGACGGAKFFGSALLQPVRSVCVSPSAFFIIAEFFPEKTWTKMEAKNKSIQMADTSTKLAAMLILTLT